MILNLPFLHLNDNSNCTLSEKVKGDARTTGTALSIHFIYIKN